jgi:hypothetical protein
MRGVARDVRFGPEAGCGTGRPPRMQGFSLPRLRLTERPPRLPQLVLRHGSASSLRLRSAEAVPRDGR